MLQRTLFAIVALFFILMNVLLWRSEILGKNQLGSPVPLRLVWEKMTTAPDHSALEIQQNGIKIGYCRWSPNVGEELATGVRMEEGPPPDGMVRNLSGYTIDFDGNVTVLGSTHVRFGLSLSLTTNHVWEQFHLQLNAQQSVYTFESTAGENAITLTSKEGGNTSTQTFTMDDLKNLEGIIGQLGGPFLGQLAKAAGLPTSSNGSRQSNQNLVLGLEWDCHHDRMHLGNARIRAYRLQATLLERFQIKVLISHVGEILRIELPDNIRFVNEALRL